MLSKPQALKLTNNDIAKTIRLNILDLTARGWAYGFDNGIHHAGIFRPGWQASVWHKPEGQHSFQVRYDREFFLHLCRSLRCSHTLDVYVEGFGMVMSAEWSGTQFRLVNLSRGEWETVHFMLPARRRA